MINLLQYLLGQRYFSEVYQKFLCSGHSFLPCDRNFALIEKKKAAAIVNVPDDWLRIIAGASPEKPFRVHKMGQNEIKDIKQLENFFTPAEHVKSNGSGIDSCEWTRLIPNFHNGKP